MHKLLQVYTDPATYKNVAYMFSSFPLGLAYFIFFTVGMSLGLGLAVILVGIPILLFMFAATKGLAAFERKLAAGLLDADIEPRRRARQGRSLAQRIFNRSTLAELLFLMLKFPLGLASFVLSITLVATTLGLVTAPLSYQMGTINAPMVGLVDSMGAALLTSALGLLLGLVTLPIINAGGAAWRTLVERLLNVGSDLEQRGVSLNEELASEDFFYDDDELYGKPKRDRRGREVTVPAMPASAMPAPKAKRPPTLREQIDAELYDEDYDDEPVHIAVPRPQPRQPDEDRQKTPPPSSSLADRIQAALHEVHPDDSATRAKPVEDDDERDDQQARS